MYNMTTTTNTLTHFSFQSFPTTFHYHSLKYRCSLKRKSLCSEFLYERTSISTRRKGMKMEERVIKIPPLRAGDGDGDDHVRVLEQESLVNGSSRQSPFLSLVSSDFESLLNHFSKWLVAGLFGGVILYRHDTEALWAAMGSVLNSALSVILKRILNQERPFSNRSSDPGMPSSHAQSIFFAVVFMVLSMVEWQGVNELTVTFAIVSLVFGSYLSWLRVSQRFHTTSQVVVGSVLGFCFALLWFWSWDSVVSDAFNSLFFIRVSVILGSVICCLGFLYYVVLNWFTEER